jgi:hypothetical protein
MAGDYEFAQKARRMTSPPQNEEKWLVGFEGVEVKFETDARRIAYFAREATWGDLMREPTDEEIADTMNEVVAGKVLGAAIEVPALAWRIRASRSTMDQMLRLRESAAGAQTTRDNDHSRFNIIVPHTIEFLKHEDPVLHRDVEELVYHQRAVYERLVKVGVPPQDIRYVCLPLGFQTQWIQIMNLRAFVKMCEQRLCNGLTQHETNYLVRVMRDAVVERYPWTDPMLRSHCEKRGACTTGGMLFPPCGAFGGVSSAQTEAHLYSADQNAGMELADWDVHRQHLGGDAPRRFAAPYGETFDA